MILNFAICEDNLKQLNILRGYINQFQGDNNICINTMYTMSSEELIKKIENIPDVDLFLMDVEMQGMNGMDCSEVIRRMYPNALIVFVTGYKDYAFDAFRIKAYDYILKPIVYKKMEKVFFRIMDIKKNSLFLFQKKFVFQSKGMTFALNYDDIYYFEKLLRKVKIVYRDGEEEFYMSNKELEETLDLEYFSRCHQSYMVNNKKINAYRNQTIVLENNNYILPVSKSYIKPIKQTIHNNLFSK